MTVNEGQVFLRSRCHQHLDNLRDRFVEMWTKTAIPKILETPDADYHFRMEVSHRVWIEIAMELAAEQEWSNFKSEAERYLTEEVAPDNSVSPYLNALHQIWGIMFRFQELDGLRKFLPGKKVALAKNQKSVMPPGRSMMAKKGKLIN